MTTQPVPPFTRCTAADSVVAINAAALLRTVAATATILRETADRIDEERGTFEHRVAEAGGVANLHDYARLVRATSDFLMTLPDATLRRLYNRLEDVSAGLIYQLETRLEATDDDESH